jgi:aerotaxis receptor
MNYKTSFDNIAERLSAFVTGEKNICGSMDAAVRRSLILTNCARLHHEMSKQIRQPDDNFDGEEKRQEHKIIAKLGDESQTLVQVSLAEASRLAATLIASAYEIRRMVLGLDTIRILGRVESRRDRVFEKACSATLDQIDTVQAAISESLQTLSNLAVSIQTGLAMISAVREPGKDRVKVAGAAPKPVSSPAKAPPPRSVKTAQPGTAPGLAAPVSSGWRDDAPPDTAHGPTPNIAAE